MFTSNNLPRTHEMVFLIPAVNYETQRGYHRKKNAIIDHK